MKERIKQIMGTVFEIDAQQIPDDVSPDIIKNWDSLRHINLILELEKAFDVKIVGEEIVKMVTIEIISAIIEEKSQILIKRK